MEQQLLVVNNLVQVGNVDNAAVAVETDHCKKKFHGFYVLVMVMIVVMVVVMIVVMVAVMVSSLGRKTIEARACLKWCLMSTCLLVKVRFFVHSAKF